MGHTLLNKALNNSLKIFFINVLDFFFPRICPACENKLTIIEDTVCNECLNKIKYAGTELIEQEFNRKFLSAGIIKAFFPLYIFEKDLELQSIIHQLKYNGKITIGLFLGKTIAVHLGSIISTLQIDLVIPVPLHRLKKAERGFNQSEFIAKGLCKHAGLKYSSKILRRKRYTDSQTTMSRAEREENVSGAFSIKNKKAIMNKNIILIDDVITTGATISECGKVLIENGAANIYAFSVAVAAL